MANNFRKTGNFYVSKAGNDSNNGTSADTPKATISAGLGLISANNQTLVIGAGTYEEAISRTGTSYSGIIMNADGLVTIKGDGTQTFTISNLTVTMTGFVITDYSIVSIVNIALFSCLLRNVPTFNCNSSITSCILINVGSTGFSPVLVSSILVNCTMWFGTMNNCYTNGFSKISLSGTSANSSDYNNIMGTIRMSSTSNPYQDLATHKTSYPTLNVHSFNSSPLFNDSAKEDFTLQSTSPHLYAASDGSNIGGTNYAKAFPTATAPEWQTANGAVWSNVSLSVNDIVVSTGFTYGTITSAPMLVSSNPVIINKLNYVGLQLFNKSKTGGTDTNKNVPDANMYSGSDASGGGNPDRLTIEMRWVNQDTQPAVDADWKNGNLIPSGTYGKFVIGSQPFVDNTQRGNGEPNYNMSIQNSVVAIWIQLRVTIRNDYA